VTVPPPPPGAPPVPLFIACLCADWCGSCREYRPVFDRLAPAAPAGERHAWIDIEDEPEVLGDLEIETFPTLLIADARGAVHFYGSVTPHAGTLERLVAGARHGELKTVGDPRIVALAQRAAAHAGAAPG
jgi:thiol-disulfide isomerase/thioredoxin